MTIDVDLITEDVTFYKIKVYEEIKSYLEVLSENIDKVDNMEELFKIYNFETEPGDELWRGYVGENEFYTDSNGQEWFEFVETNHNVRTSFMKQFRDFLDEDGFKLIVFYQENDYRCNSYYTNDFFRKHFRPFFFCNEMEDTDIYFLTELLEDAGATEEELNELDYSSMEDFLKLADKYDLQVTLAEYEYSEL